MPLPAQRGAIASASSAATRRRLRQDDVGRTVTVQQDASDGSPAKRRNTVNNNSALPQCEADAFTAQLTQVCGVDLYCDVDGNNVDSGCECGDSVRYLGEGCDDGNTTAADGCSDVCAVEANYTCSGITPDV